MSVREGVPSETMQKNPDLERLEIALVQLGFALEQQEIQAEAERTRHEEGRKALLERVEALETRLRGVLNDAGVQGAGMQRASMQDERASSVVEEGK